jgi:hypothetical protein
LTVAKSFLHTGNEVGIVGCSRAGGPGLKTAKEFVPFADINDFAGLEQSFELPGVTELAKGYGGHGVNVTRFVSQIKPNALQDTSA